MTGAGVIGQAVDGCCGGEVVVERGEWVRLYISPARGPDWPWPKLRESNPILISCDHDRLRFTHAHTSPPRGRRCRTRPHPIPFPAPLTLHISPRAPLFPDHQTLRLACFRFVALLI